MSTAKPKEVAYGALKAKIEKLMENPDKNIDIEDSKTSESSKKYEPPEFVRNVMGSSAGAGSGEFHLYRHLRRKEMARLKGIETSAKLDDLSQEYKDKLDQNERIAEERTSKRRAKREKAKERKKKRLAEIKNSKGKTSEPPNNEDNASDSE